MAKSTNLILFAVLIMLFAILFQISSTGMGVISIVIGLVGLFVGWMGVNWADHASQLNPLERMRHEQRHEGAAGEERAEP